MALDFPQQGLLQCREGIPDSGAAVEEDPMRLNPGSARYGNEIFIDGFSGPSVEQSARFARVTRGQGYRDDVNLPPSDGPGTATGGGLGRIIRPIGNFFKAIGRGFLALIGIETGSQPSTASSRTVGLVDPGEVSTGGGMDLSSLQRRVSRAQAVEERVSVYYTGRHSVPVIIRRPVVRPATVVARPPTVRCAIP